MITSDSAALHSARIHPKSAIRCAQQSQAARLCAVVNTAIVVAEDKWRKLALLSRDHRDHMRDAPPAQHLAVIVERRPPSEPQPWYHLVQQLQLGLLPAATAVPETQAPAAALVWAAPCARPRGTRRRSRERHSAICTASARLCRDCGTPCRQSKVSQDTPRVSGIA